MSKYEKLWSYVKACGKEKIELSFKETETISGVPVDHSFLRYKSELNKFGYEVTKISVKSQTILFVKTANKSLVIYVHGKGGSAAEAERYKPLFIGCDVKGLNYKAETPWQAKEEFPKLFDDIAEGYNSIVLIANSIGAYFSMCALPQEKIKKAYFISPILDMERLISDMMRRANVTEEDLKEKGKIETLSWEYLSYVRANPVNWNVPTEILYGEKDNLTSKETVTDFANGHNAKLTVMHGGEHWFHTAEQTRFLDEWIISGETK